MMLLALIAFGIASAYLIYITNWHVVANRALHWLSAIGVYVFSEHLGVISMLTKLVKGLA